MGLHVAAKSAAKKDMGLQPSTPAGYAHSKPNDVHAKFPEQTFLELLLLGVQLRYSTSRAAPQAAEPAQLCGTACRTTGVTSKAQ